MIRVTALAVVVALWAGCGGGGNAPPDDVPDDASVQPIDSGDGDAGVVPDGGVTPVLVFQPGYRAALRGSTSIGSPMTYRMKIRTVRAGGRIRLVFRAGAGALTLFAANVAHAGTNGDFVGPAAVVTFGGSAGKVIAADSTVVSDPVAFSVAKGDELYVSYELQGTAAYNNAISLLPGSFSRSGNFVSLASGFAGAAETVPRALVGLDAEAVQQRLFIGIGDSITEGYVSGTTGDDYRNSWPAVASSTANPPVVAAAVSGQGVLDALNNVNTEVLQIDGITDCIVLIGTNDLQSSPGQSATVVQQIKDRLSQLFAALQPKCNVWVSTLLPKDTVGTTSSGIMLPEVNQRRNDINTWIRALPSPLRVIDLEVPVRDPADHDRYASGKTADGIHPSVAGQALLGQFASNAIQ